MPLVRQNAYVLFRPWNEKPFLVPICIPCVCWRNFATVQARKSEKTRMFCSKSVDRTDAIRLIKIMGVKWTTDLGRYLGVPLLHKKVERGTYQYIVDKVRKRITNWGQSRYLWPDVLTFCSYSCHADICKQRLCPRSPWINFINYVDGVGSKKRMQFSEVEWTLQTEGGGRTRDSWHKLSQ